MTTQDQIKAAHDGLIALQGRTYGSYQDAYIDYASFMDRHKATLQAVLEERLRPEITDHQIIGILYKHIGIGIPDAYRTGLIAAAREILKR